MLHHDFSAFGKEQREETSATQFTDVQDLFLRIRIGNIAMASYQPKPKTRIFWYSIAVLEWIPKSPHNHLGRVRECDDTRLLVRYSHERYPKCIMSDL
jgi:hypothetical protein